MEPASVVAPGTDQIKVSVADYGISAAETLRTSGLGSCLGIALHDPEAGLGGLVHPMRPYRDGENRAPSRYVDSGVELLVDELAARGADPTRLEARVTGGATVVEFEWGDGGDTPVGPRNVAAVERVLATADIDVVAMETGGKYGRSMQFDPGTGRVTVQRTDGTTTVL